MTRSRSPRAPLRAKYDLWYVSVDRRVKLADIGLKSKHRDFHCPPVEVAAHLLIWMHLPLIIVPPGPEETDQRPSKSQKRIAVTAFMVRPQDGWMSELVFGEVCCCFSIKEPIFEVGQH